MREERFYQLLKSKDNFGFSIIKKPKNPKIKYSLFMKENDNNNPIKLFSFNTPKRNNCSLELINYLNNKKTMTY